MFFFYADWKKQTGSERSIAFSNIFMIKYNSNVDKNNFQIYRQDKWDFIASPLSSNHFTREHLSAVRK